MTPEKGMSTFTPQAFAMTIGRYNTDGNLDTEERGTGKWDMIQKAPKITRKHDAGHACVPPRYKLRLGRVPAYAGVAHMAMTRYDGDGALDTSFGSGYGFVTTDFGSWAICSSVLVDGDGKIVAGGQAAGSMAFVRYNSNGTLDNDFNGDGKLIVPMGSSSSIGRMALDGDGRIVAAGWARPAGFTFGLVRLRIDPANGTLEGTFGEGGTLITDVYNNWGGGMTIQGDGDIVVVGSVSGGAFLTARYKGTGQQRLYYQQDANWNVTALVSADDAAESYTGGAVVERYLTDPYGNVVTLTASWYPRRSDFSQVSYYGNVYFHQDLEYDAISGTYDDKNRRYNPRLGRPLQPDPIGYGDGMNPYQMYGSNPVARLDPSGRSVTIIAVESSPHRDVEGSFIGTDRPFGIDLKAAREQTAKNVKSLSEFLSRVSDKEFDDWQVFWDGQSFPGTKDGLLGRAEREQVVGITQVKGKLAELVARAKQEAQALSEPWDQLGVLMHSPDREDSFLPDDTVAKTVISGALKAVGALVITCFVPEQGGDLAAGGVDSLYWRPLRNGDGRICGVSVVPYKITSDGKPATRPTAHPSR